MAIADTIQSMYENVGEVYDTITNVDLPTNKNIQNIPSTMRSSYLEIMNNGIDKIWNNWEKVTGEGETLTLNSTEEAPMKIDLKGNTSQATLPSGYTAVDYIASSGTQYINTGLFPSSNLKVETKIEVASTNQDITVFGSSLASSSGGSLGGYYHLTPYNNKWYYGANNSEGNGGSYSAIVGTQYEIIFNDEDGGIKINGTSIASNKTFVGISDSTLTISRRGSSSGNRFGYFKYFYFKIYNKGTNALVRDYIPCYRNSDNAVGMYDLVNNVFYTNAGTGAFTYGAVATFPNPDYPQDIHVVSGDNSIDVCGKNIFDKSKDIVEGYTFGNNNTYISASDFFYQSYYIPVKPNTTYSFLGQKTIGTDSLRVCEYKSDKEFIKRNYELYTITTTQDTRYIRLSNYKTKLDTTQVEISSTSTTYEAYKGASYPISLGVENLLDISNQPVSLSYSGNYKMQTLASNLNLNLSSGNYTISLDIKSANGNRINKILFYDSNNTDYTWTLYKIIPTSYQNNKYTFTFENDITITRIDVQNAEGGDTYTFNNIQLEKGSKANSYTPFGTTPIELCKIGDYQDSIKKSTGKNLFDKDTIEEGKRLGSDGLPFTDTSFDLSDYIKVDSNTQYTYSRGSNGSGSSAIAYYDSSKTFISRTMPIMDSNAREVVLTTPNNATYVRIADLKTTLDSMQFEEGNQATSYEPYGTSWYLNKQIGKRVLDGTESWTTRVQSGLHRFDLGGMGSVGGSAQNNPILSKYFLSKYAEANNVVYLASGAGIMSIMSNNFTDLATFKTWLSTNNTPVYYALQTPTYTEITDSTLISQLEALNGSKSYTTQTNINQENNDLPFILDVTALKQLTQ